MRIAHFTIMVCAVLACGSATAPTPLEPQETNVVKARPLILEKNDGERRVVRGWPGHPNPGETMILKVDRKNGDSSHLVFFTADLPPGNAIETHQHAHADEILFLQTGTAQVHLGDTVKEAHAGATVFIPAGTLISVSNIGSDAVKLVCVFSAPGFEDFIRDTSIREGERNVPLSQAEENEIEKKYAHIISFKEP